MRRSGRTTKQLEEIVRRAQNGDQIAFVWVEDRTLAYPADIVAKLAPGARRSEGGRSFSYEGGGRIWIIPPSANVRMFHGTLFDVVFDHATWDLPRSAIVEMVDAMQDQAQRRAVLGGLT